MAPGSINSWQIEGERVEAVTDFLFLGSKITVDGDCSHKIRRRLLLGRKAMTNHRSPYSQGNGLSSGHVRLWELDCKEGWTPKNWCLQTAVLEKTPESPLDSKIKPVNLKGNHPQILIWRTDAEAETPVFWSFDANSQLIRKVSDIGKDWGQKEKRASEAEVAGQHH